ncbi:MAG TPA: glycosyltransferase [Vicinamibacterales bacterium]|nr:glycosyltransferase [Vicinamibacterales bacterium]
MIGSPFEGLRVALVHDWLTGMRGGERVLEALVRMFPRAEIFTLLHVPGSVSAELERRTAHRSVVQRLPAAARLYRHYLPMFPFAIEQFDLDRFDLIVSSSHCAAKAVVPAGRAVHVCYCHSPMRYAWDQFDAYFGEERVGRVAARLLRRYMGRLARWDADTASRVHRFVANSRHVAARIARYYGRAARVVHPPVDTEFFTPEGRLADNYLLIVSALVPYKRLDLAIAAAEAAELPLKIVGRGPELSRLSRMAPPQVEFLGSRSNEEIRALYRGAAALVMPGEEDFGMVPVEAQACGCPVVALARGGALESVVDGVTGVLVRDASVSAFADGLRRVRRMPIDVATMRAHVEKFSTEVFIERMTGAINDALCTRSQSSGARNLNSGLNPKPEQQNPEP